MDSDVKHYKPNNNKWKIIEIQFLYFPSPFFWILVTEFVTVFKIYSYAFVKLYPKNLEDAT